MTFKFFAAVLSAIFFLVAYLVYSRGAEAAQPNWLQFCDDANVRTKPELYKVVSEWKKCHLPRQVFFAKLSGVTGVPISELRDFRHYLDSPDREMVACNWRQRGDVEIDHIVKGKQIRFGQSWRPCRQNEFVLIDKAKNGAVVLSGWCLNTVHDKRKPTPPTKPPPPLPQKAAKVEKQEVSPYVVPPASPIKEVKLGEKPPDFVGCNQVDSTVVVQPEAGHGIGYGFGRFSFSTMHFESGSVVQTISQCFPKNN